MNKSRLLASTMLVSAAALMAAGSANAAELKLGGFSEWWVGVGDQNSAADAVTNTVNDFDVKSDAEINFRAEETLDNGIKVGVLFEMEAGVGNDGALFDESFAWVKTKWGQINVGNNDTASGYMGGLKTVGPVGNNKTDATNWTPGIDARLANSDIDVGVGDAGNVTYFTPKVAGVQAIMSYTPDSSDTAVNAFKTQATSGFQDAVSAAVKYSGKFGGVGVSVSGGWTHVKTGSGKAYRDGHGVSTVVSFGPATVSGVYVKENLAINEYYYGVAALYAITKTDKVSIGWSSSEDADRGVGLKDLSTDVYTIGLAKDLGKGISFQASAFLIEQEAATGSDPDGMGVVGGFRLNF